MSELDQSTLGSLDAARTRDVELAALIGERTEREGLPRNYRMRAEAHYVDQLDRPQAGPVVRLIATRHIDAGGSLPPTPRFLHSVSRSRPTASCSRCSSVDRQPLSIDCRTEAARGRGHRRRERRALHHPRSERSRARWRSPKPNARRQPPSNPINRKPTVWRRSFRRSRRISRGSDRWPTSSSSPAIRFSSGPRRTS